MAMLIPRLTLRRKLLLLSLILALLPLSVAGWRMVRITHDELKSVVNDELVNNARLITEEIGDLYRDSWLTPLLLIRNAIDSDNLGVEEKVSLLSSGIEQVTDVIALQISAEGVPNSILASKKDFEARLQAANLQASDTLRLPPDGLSEYMGKAGIFNTGLSHIAETDDWLLTLALPLAKPLLERPAVLTARINLDRLRRFLGDHPFAKTGNITVVDDTGAKLFDPARPDLSGVEIVAETIALLATPARPISVKHYDQANGESLIAAYAFPESFNWAVILEKRKEDAYAAVNEMVNHLLIWVLFGVVIAAAGALLLALQISRPILKIAQTALAVSQGDLQARVKGVNSKDEIGDLADRFNNMINGLIERFALEKFVSVQTIDAIREADTGGVKLGGERKRITVLFSDIRGFTAFSEQVAPDTVVQMLNIYLRRQAEIVQRHGGDIDKFVGDELVAVFHGEAMARQAVLCALAIQEAMVTLADAYPEWRLAVGIGINTGDAVVGAVGSKQRMDFTVLGDSVNLGARLCNHAGPGETLITDQTYRKVAAMTSVSATRLTPINVKGKIEPVPVFAVTTTAEAAVTVTE